MPEQSRVKNKTHLKNCTGGNTLRPKTSKVLEHFKLNKTRKFVYCKVFKSDLAWHGKAFNPKNTIYTVRHVDGDIMLSGYFSANGAGNLFKQNIIQDSDPKHTAKVVMVGIINISNPMSYSLLPLSCLNGTLHLAVGLLLPLSALPSHRE
uniref:Uncharacterized protein n=1 Tax=Mola mola TaxID=94237 RepID=A0A3Q4AUK6_MOLML